MKLKDFIEHRGKLRNINRFGMESVIKRQNLCEHGFNTATLFVLLCEIKEVPVSGTDIWYVMQHDFAEVFTGDLNLKVKNQIPKLWEEVEKSLVPNELENYLDSAFREALGEEKFKIFKFSDALDALLYIEDEMRLGNSSLNKAYIYYENKLVNLDQELFREISMSGLRRKNVEKF